MLTLNHSMKLLVITINRLARKVPKHYLPGQGYNLCLPLNGLVALNHPDNQNRHVVILVDLFIPELTGPSIQFKIKHHFKSKLQKNVIVSAVNNAENFIKKPETPCDYFILKPFSTKDLGTLLHNIPN